MTAEEQKIFLWVIALWPAGLLLKFLLMYANLKLAQRKFQKLADRQGFGIEFQQKLAVIAYEARLHPKRPFDSRNIRGLFEYLRNQCGIDTPHAGISRSRSQNGPAADG